MVRAFGLDEREEHEHEGVLLRADAYQRHAIVRSVVASNEKPLGSV